MKDFELLIYNTPTEDVKVNVVLKDETIWATQKAMAALFGVQVSAISKHIFESGELSPSATVSKMETVVQKSLVLNDNRTKAAGMIDTLKRWEERESIAL